MSDTKISQQGLHWHFQHLFDETKLYLSFLEGMFRESQDFKGQAHKAYVESAVANIKQHIAEAEQFLKEQS